MDIQEKQKHKFAFFFSTLSYAVSQAQVNRLSIDDETVYHRIVNVLRLKPQEIVTLFDADMYVEFQLLEVSRKNISGSILFQQLITPPTPFITVMLPVLKKEALEEAVYTCGELGANTIQFIMTEKTHRSCIKEKELSRFRNILIAAAEQSKQLALPLLNRPITLETALNIHKKDTMIVCCFSGNPFIQLLNTLLVAPIVLFIGPEGDFTLKEYNLFKTYGAPLYALTKTTLRSQQALAITLGGLRSL